MKFSNSDYISHIESFARSIMDNISKIRLDDNMHRLATDVVSVFVKGIVENLDQEKGFIYINDQNMSDSCYRERKLLNNQSFEKVYYPSETVQTRAVIEQRVIENNGLEMAIMNEIAYETSVKLREYTLGDCYVVSDPNFFVIQQPTMNMSKALNFTLRFSEMPKIYERSRYEPGKSSWRPTGLYLQQDDYKSFIQNTPIY